MTNYAPLITYNESCLRNVSRIRERVMGGFFMHKEVSACCLEVYLDMIFLINLIMNYLLLRTVRKLLKLPPERIRCFWGSILGAFGVCLGLCLPVHKTFVNLLPVHMVTSTLMVKVGCKIKNVRVLVKGVCLLYLTAFLGGGMFFALYQSQTGLHLRTFLFFGVFFYELLMIFHDVYRKWKRSGNHYCEVTLFANEKSKKVRGLYDTGNRLLDSLSGKPVSVIDAEILREFYGEGIEYREELRPHYITYRAVGTPRGMLLAVTLEKMEVSMEGQSYSISQPILALSEENISFTQHYQLILNPNLIDY